MNEIKNLLINNWQLIVAAIIFILSFILQLIKKKPVEVIDSVITFIHNNIVHVINDVEVMANGSKSVFYDGYVTSKIDVAISLMKKEIASFFPNVDANLYSLLIRNIIEEILSTPQKKGGNFHAK